MGAAGVEPEPAEPRELESETARQGPSRLSLVASRGGGESSCDAPSTAVRAPAALRPAHPRRRQEGAARTAHSGADAVARREEVAGADAQRTGTAARTSRRSAGVARGAHEAAEQGQEQEQGREQELGPKVEEAPFPGWAWPEKRTMIEVHVLQTGREEAEWVPARVLNWRVDGRFQAAIGGADPFKDWLWWKVRAHLPPSAQPLRNPCTPLHTPVRPCTPPPHTYGRTRTKIGGACEVLSRL